MIELGVMFGLMGVTAFALIVKLLLRRNRTENVDGLLIEQASRVQAHNNRVTYSSTAVHSSSPTVRGYYRP
ncbi:hypothetical protein [Streptomyces sp. RKAG290]|uniref:hypothetical protein n=1 Tax=Streptomyces sp. RKAG290 TaxID=2888348 RepID=UPI002033F3B7|nr:hypothetical protein [Streptomyces sp. RKAG290]MCM2413552.1 hypothetical protein [Streptomyces sp. RKAG290]